MSRIFLEDISQYVGEEVVLKGWVYNFRSSGKISFLQFRDGTSTIQGVVVKNDVSEKVWEEIQQLTLESSVELIGKVKEDDRSPSGFELDVTSFRIIQKAEDYPISKKEHGPDFLLDHRHLWLRSPRQWAIMRIRDTIITSLHTFLRENKYMHVDTPIITPNACEGTTELFSIDYFGEEAYLAQTGQLYIEAAIMSVGRAYDFGPVFRAEKSKTRRHLIEFWMLDVETAFCEHQQNMQIQEDMIFFVLSSVLKNNTFELGVLERDISALQKIKAPFLRKTYEETVLELQSMGSDIQMGEDLGADDETMLTQKYSNPIFVEKYPWEVKAFYMKRDPGDERYVLNNDLLAPEGYGEIIGGSQREDDYATLKASIERENLKVSDFEWYLDLRKYGSVPHSGFGIGLERLVGWICGTKHVRETIAFPRLLNRMKP